MTKQLLGINNAKNMNNEKTDKIRRVQFPTCCGKYVVTFLSNYYFKPRKTLLELSEIIRIGTSIQRI